MKNQWPIWIFVLIVIVIVLFALNYQGRHRAVPLSEIFPDEKTEEMSNKVEYEFVNQAAAPEQEEYAEGTPASTPVKVSDVTVPAATKTVKPVAMAGQESSATHVPATATTSKKPIAAVPAASSTAVKTIHGKYTIQVASHNTKESADAAVKKIKAAGYPAFVLKVESKTKGTHYRIYIGDFATKKEADAYLPKVKKDYPSSFVLERRR